MDNARLPSASGGSVPRNTEAPHILNAWRHEQRAPTGSRTSRPAVLHSGYPNLQGVQGHPLQTDQMHEAATPGRGPVVQISPSGGGDFGQPGQGMQDFTFDPNALQTELQATMQHLQRLMHQSRGGRIGADQQGTGWLGETPK